MNMMNTYCNMLKNELKNDLKYGPISLEKEIEYGNNGNVTALQEHNLRFALGMVKKFMNKYAGLFESGLLTEEELTSAACIALSVACSKWNPAMGFKVATYAGMYIKKAMDQYMCKEVQRSRERTHGLQPFQLLGYTRQGVQEVLRAHFQGLSFLRP